jgi:hypothetical protein
MNRANLAVPDSKAAKTKIARNKNESGNSARVKNKAAAANKAVINKQATSKADDKSCFIGVLKRRKATPAVSPLRPATGLQSK